MTTQPSFRRGAAAVAATALAASALVLAPSAAHAADGHVYDSVVINEVYGGGGNSGAPLSHDFVELFNPTDEAVDLTPLSIEYRSASGGTGGTVDLDGTIEPEGHFLVQLAAGGNTDLPGLPTPDQDGGNVGMSGTNGRVFLFENGSGFDSGVAGDRAGAEGLVDMVGYGSASSFLVASTQVLSNRTSASRVEHTGDNSADFTVGAPNPTNSLGESEGEGPDDGEPEEPQEPVDAVEMTIAEANQAAHGTRVAVQGVVTADWGDGGFNGFVIQDPEGDPTDGVSDAIFVYNPGATPSLGSSVAFEADRAEYNGIEQLANAGTIETIDDLGEVTPVTDASILLTEEGREAHRAELVRFEDEFTVSDNYSLNFYGSFAVTLGDDITYQPTSYVDPHDTAAVAEFADEQQSRTIVVDDARSMNFNTTSNRGNALTYLTPENPVRVGSAAAFNAPGVLDYRFDQWAIQPTSPIEFGDDGSDFVTVDNGRIGNETPRALDGDITIANFNVLNYFPTTGEEYQAATGINCSWYTDRAGDPVGTNRCGDAGPRGAANQENFERQQVKTVKAITELDASILSLQEIENGARFDKDRDFALDDLVDALNEYAGGDIWAYAESPAEVPSDEDVIRNGFIYQVDDVELVGESHILIGDDAFHNAREPLFQGFKPAGAGDDDAFLVSANHFKSKGSGYDDGTGQGNANPDRIAQAESLIEFTAEVQETTGIDAVFQTGDFNAYAAEDPAKVIESAGFTNVNYELNDGAPTYLFGGLSGSLDHVYANEDAMALISDVDVWQINGQEQIGFEYSRYNYNATLLYDDSVFRTSDHNPITVGLTFDEPAEETAEITLLTINDFHGRIEAGSGGVAGAAVLAGAVDAYKSENPNTLLVSAGDNIGASTFTSFIQEDVPTIETLTMAGLDVGSVGNHEFDGGFADLTDRVIPRFDDFAAQYDASYDSGSRDGEATSYGEAVSLGANVYQKGTTEPALPEYAIKEVDGVAIGFIGTVTEDTQRMVSPTGIADIEFGDQLEAANRVAAQIDELVDVTILLTHSGAEVSGADEVACERIANEQTAFGSLVRGADASIDAIVSGHTHQAYPCIIDGRPVLQAEDYGKNLGKLDLTVTDGELVSIDADIVPLTGFEADAAVQTVVDAAADFAREEGQKPVGKISADILRGQVEPGENERGVESSMGNLVADIYQWATTEYVNYGGEPADLAVMNPGGLRADILHEGDGTVTYQQAADVQPFANTLTTTPLTGADIELLLEQQWQPGASRAKLHLGISEGFEYEYLDNDDGTGTIVSMTLNGEPVDEAATYLVATNSFVAGGGDGFTAFDNAPFTDTGLIDLSATVDYFAAHDVVDPAPLNRAILATDGPTDPTDPGTDPTDPGTDPTDPGTDPTDPGTDPTDPGTDPTDPGTDPGAGPITDPTGPGGGATGPTAPSLADLGAQGGIDVLDDAVAGETIRVFVGLDHAGDEVWGWLYSEPTPLGSAIVAADGTATFTIPAGIAPGEHRIVVTDADGNVIGWDYVTVAEAGTELPATGSDVPWSLALGAAGLLIAGAVLTIARRRSVA